jgi:hypothetical protein
MFGDCVRRLKWRVSTRSIRAIIDVCKNLSYSIDIFNKFNLTALMVYEMKDFATFTLQYSRLLLKLTVDNELTTFNFDRGKLLKAPG